MSEPTRQQVARIDELVREVEGLPGPSREKARALLTAVLDLHRDALERLMGAVGPVGAAAEALADDERVAAVLLLHGLHPRSLEERVARALEQARPRLRSHGGDVELVSLTDDALRLRLVGACNGCPSSSLTLRGLIDKALLEAAPDAPPLVVEGVTPVSTREPALTCPS